MMLSPRTRRQSGGQGHDLVAQHMENAGPDKRPRESLDAAQQQHRQRIDGGRDAE